MKKLICLLTLFAALSACQKKPPYQDQGYINIVADGRIIDVYSGEPIDSAVAEVRVVGRRGWGWGLGPVRRRYKADASGRFNFGFKADLDSAYTLWASAKGYYGVGTAVGKLFNGNKSTYDYVYLDYHNPWRENFPNNVFKLVPVATLRVHLVNVHGVYVNFSLNGPPGSPLGSGFQASGYNVNRIDEFKVWGGTDIELQTFRYRPGDGPGDGDHVKVKVFCTPHSVTDLLIEY